MRIGRPLELKPSSIFIARTATATIIFVVGIEIVFPHPPILMVVVTVDIFLKAQRLRVGMSESVGEEVPSLVVSITIRRAIVFSFENIPVGLFDVLVKTDPPPQLRSAFGLPLPLLLCLLSLEKNFK